MKAVQIERKWEGDNTKCHFPFISQKGAIQHTTEDNFYIHAYQLIWAKLIELKLN